MTQKTNKTIYYISTSLLFILFFFVEIYFATTMGAGAAVMRYGYPAYFGKLLLTFKLLGILALVIPQVPNRVKEWAYAGFGFTTISALVSVWATSGMSMGVNTPVIVMIILITSYVTWLRLQKTRI